MEGRKGGRQREREGTGTGNEGTVAEGGAWEEGAHSVLGASSHLGFSLTLSFTLLLHRKSNFSTSVWNFATSVEMQVVTELNCGMCHRGRAERGGA
jgi:hypothetical protein